MIILQDICKIYTRDAEVRALDGINLTVHDGEFLSIVGASGSGKTTLMHILGCLDRPTSGRYWLDGEAVDRLSSTRLSNLRGRRIGFVFQAFRLVSGMTALENVALPLVFQGVGRQERLERAREALGWVGLSERLTHTPSMLSGGQQQRTAIARAIVTRPSVILADEPTGNLDPESAADIMQLFRRLHQNGCTLVLITHDRSVAAQAERQIAIEKGRIVEAEGDF